MKQRAASFHRHVRAHQAVIANEHWYGDGPLRLKASFSAAKTAERHAAVGASPVIRERFITALRAYLAGSSSAAG
jgi:hypothetical protein